MHLTGYAKKREVLYETPRDVELGFHASTEQRRQLLATQPNTNSTILSELDSKRLLQAYDIPTTPIELARDANEVESIGERLGYPLVMKIHSPTSRIKPKSKAWCSISRMDMKPRWPMPR